MRYTSDRYPLALWYCAFVRDVGHVSQHRLGSCLAAFDGDHNTHFTHCIYSGAIMATTDSVAVIDGNISFKGNSAASIGGEKHVEESNDIILPLPGASKLFLNTNVR